MFELLDKHGYIPESRSEILFTSKFMETNNLTTYSSIYYKNNIYSFFIHIFLKICYNYLGDNKCLM